MARGKKGSLYKQGLVLQSVNCLMGCGTQKKSIALWDVEHKKGIADGGELYKVGEKIVV